MAAASIMAFHPVGNLVVIAGATVAPAPVQVLVTEPDSHFGEYLFYNRDTVRAYLSWGSTAAQATARAIVPTPGVPTPVLSLPPGVYASFRLIDNAFMTVITSSGTASVEVLPGYGL